MKWNEKLYTYIFVLFAAIVYTLYLFSFIYIDVSLLYLLNYVLVIHSLRLYYIV